MILRFPAGPCWRQVVHFFNTGIKLVENKNEPTEHQTRSVTTRVLDTVVPNEVKGRKSETRKGLDWTSRRLQDRARTPCLTCLGQIEVVVGVQR